MSILESKQTTNEFIFSFDFTILGVNRRQILIIKRFINHWVKDQIFSDESEYGNGMGKQSIDQILIWEKFLIYYLSNH